MAANNNKECMLLLIETGVLTIDMFNEENKVKCCKINKIRLIVCVLIFVEMCDK